MTASRLVLSIREDMSEDAQRTQAEVATLATVFGVKVSHAT
jgi:hypothetical protein